MNTDEMILALVKWRGFELPVCLQFWPNGRPGLFAHASWTMAGLLLDQVYAHDLCAMEFARQRDNTQGPGGHKVAYMKLMAHGDSAAAIKALYEAMETK